MITEMAIMQIRQYLKYTTQKMEFILCQIIQVKGDDFVKYEEVKEYIGKTVVVTDVDDKKFRGVITNTESEFDTESGKEEIELDTGKVWYGIPIDEIKEIMPIEK